MLTSRQMQCFNIIKSHLLETGRSPTYRDIATELGNTPPAVHSLVSRIVEAGMLRRMPTKSNALSLAVQYFKLMPEGLVRI